MKLSEYNVTQLLAILLMLYVTTSATAIYLFCDSNRVILAL